MVTNQGSDTKSDADEGTFRRVRAPMTNKTSGAVESLVDFVTFGTNRQVADRSDFNTLVIVWRAVVTWRTDAPSIGADRATVAVKELRTAVLVKSPASATDAVATPSLATFTATTADRTFDIVVRVSIHGFMVANVGLCRAGMSEQFVCLPETELSISRHVSMSAVTPCGVL